MVIVTLQVMMSHRRRYNKILAPYAYWDYRRGGRGRRKTPPPPPLRDESFIIKRGPGTSRVVGNRFGDLLRGRK